MSSIFRATFLILAAAKLSHLSFLEMCVLVVGYYFAARFDQWFEKRTRQPAIEEVIEDETTGWERGADDSKYETKGNFKRLKLPLDEEIVVTRGAAILRRIEQAKMGKPFGVE